MNDLFSFQVLGHGIGVQCDDAELLALVRANWGHMASDARADVVYAVSKDSASITVRPPGRAQIVATDTGEFLHALERHVVTDLQQRRADLYFLHAAAVEAEGKAHLFIAESGRGKSTSVWGLLHHGFGYLSDELAPIDLRHLLVHAYPHALCVKRAPPAPYRLPAETVHTPWTLHVPVRYLPRVAAAGLYPLATLWFVTYRPALAAPAVRAITAGEAAAHSMPMR